MFLILESKFKFEDGKYDFSFEYIGCEFLVDYVSREESINGEVIIGCC